MTKRMMVTRIAVVAAAMAFPVARPAAHQQQQAAQMQQPPAPKPFTAFRLSGPTFFADGKTRGASVGLLNPIFFNQPIEWFQYSGKTLCMSSSATPTAPTDAGYGWRVLLMPLPARAADSIELDVEWERRWERGAAVNGPRGKSRVSLQPGDKVMLDYIPAGMTTPGCDAIGMGLQIEMLPASASRLGDIVEADLWLVRKASGETIERQTVRVLPGESTPFHFKDVGIAITDPIKIDRTYYFQNKAEIPGLTVRTTGRLAPTAIKGERVTATIELSQDIAGLGIVAGAAWRPDRAGDTPTTKALSELLTRRGGASFEFTAVPSEVVEFLVPKLTETERLAVRVQMRVLAK